MRYSRYYTKKNRDGSRTVVRLGPAATFAHFFVDVFAGVFAGGLIIVGSGIQSQTARDWIIWSFGAGVPFLAWFGRRAAAKRR
jgi:hypothetical protein